VVIGVGMDILEKEKFCGYYSALPYCAACTAYLIHLKTGGIKRKNFAMDNLK
jgi:hypothetical protein